MNYDNFSNKEKNIFLSFLLENKAELFEMITVLIEERIKSIVPNMIKDYLYNNP